MNKKKPDFKSYCLYFFTHNNGIIYGNDGGKYIEGKRGQIIAFIIYLIVIVLTVFITNMSIVIKILLCLFMALILGPFKYFFTTFEEIGEKTKVKNKQIIRYLGATNGVLSSSDNGGMLFLVYCMPDTKLINQYREYTDRNYYI